MASLAEAEWVLEGAGSSEKAGPATEEAEGDDDSVVSGDGREIGAEAAERGGGGQFSGDARYGVSGEKSTG